MLKRNAKSTNLKSVGLIFCIFCIAACSQGKSPVDVRETISREVESERLGGRVVTIIRPGDTWYGVAFENNITTSELAAWNGMSDQDTLHVGQRLRLTKPLDFQRNSNSSSLSTVVADSKNVVVIRSAPQVDNDQSVAKPAEIVTPKIVKTPEKLIIKTPKQPQFKQGFDKKNLRWAWPLQGKVVNKFSPNQGRKGIDISGQQNQAVKVAAPGKVVYQGNGVKGYNNLIIVKHTEDLLSAYAHNQQVYVKEGQWVQENQTISTVGLKKGQPLLHFEIRRKGKPVDPLQYLGG